MKQFRFCTSGSILYISGLHNAIYSAEKLRTIAFYQLIYINVKYIQINNQRIICSSFLGLSQSNANKNDPAGIAISKLAIVVFVR